MRKVETKLRKICIVLITFSLWLYWDLSQAHSAMTTIYKSFFLDSEMKASSSSSSTATVAIVRSNDSALGADTCSVTSESITYPTIYKMVKHAVELVCGPTGLRRIIKSGDTVLIKPNIVQWDSSGSGGVTDVRVVKALVFLIDSIAPGHIKIIVGEGSPRPYTTFEKIAAPTTTPWVQLFDVPGYQQLKIDAQKSGIDFRISNLNGNDDTNPWPELDTVSVPGGGQAQPQGGKYFVHRDVTHASVYIAVPVMKIHKDVRYTGALKDQIGLAASSRYGFSKTAGVSQDGYIHKLLHTSQIAATWHNWQDKEIVDLAAIAKIKFVIMDAITCLDSTKTPKYSGSSSTPNIPNINISNRIKMNTIIAGYDPVAVDNVCCRIMELNPDDIRYLTLAECVGLGTNNPDNITVVGAMINQTKRLFRYAQPFSTTNTSSYGQSNRTWLLSNYYLTSGISNPMDKPFISDEATLTPSAGVNGWSQAIYFIDDQILLGDYYQSLDSIRNSQAGVSYAFTYFTVPAAQQAELWVGSDESIKIYLNGLVVYNYSGTRSFTGDQFFNDDTCIINLQQGTNKLLVKSYQSIGKYLFSINICEIQHNLLYKGNRIMGLKFVTTGINGTNVNDKNVSTISLFELKNNYPNPFNPATMITYQIAKASSVKLVIYDIKGREIATLVNGEKAAGTYSIPWDASHISSGVYFNKLTAGNFSQVKKMVLMK